MEMMTGSHDELIELVEQQQAIIADLRATIIRLEQRIPDLEGGVASPRRMPGHKPTSTAVKGDRPPRAKRRVNLARRRASAAVRVPHALTVCPHSGAPLAGGSITRTREVIELAPQPVVTEHVYLARCCGACQNRPIPAATSASAAMSDDSQTTMIDGAIALEYADVSGNVSRRATLLSTTVADGVTGWHPPRMVGRDGCQQPPHTTRLRTGRPNWIRCIAGWRDTSRAASRASVSVRIWPVC